MSAHPPSPPPEFSRPVALAGAERAPFRVKGEASAPERAALAKRFDLLDLERLSYEAEIRPWRDGGWRAAGRIKARAAQACVVTLEPVWQEIDEAFGRGWLPARFLPEASAGPDSEVEIPVDPEIDDFPEELTASVDLGEAAAETLSLALDPYPRAVPAAAPELRVGARPAGAEELTDEKVHPFARLAGLKGTPPESK